MSKEREIQKVILEERRLGQIMDNLYREIATLEMAIFERRRATDTLIEDLKSPLIKKNVLIPIGGEIYLHASIEDTDKALVNVGADVYITKKKEETKNFLEETISAYEKAHKERVDLFNNIKRKREDLNNMLLEYQLEKERDSEKVSQ